MRNILPITVLVLLVVPGVSGAAALGSSPPGAAMQFAPCFQTADQRAATIKTIRRALRDPETGQNPDVRSVCSSEHWISGRETLGVWLSPLPPAGDLLGQNNVQLHSVSARPSINRQPTPPGQLVPGWCARDRRIGDAG
jgi:hypothetical protein